MSVKQTHMQSAELGVPSSPSYSGLPTLNSELSASLWRGKRGVTLTEVLIASTVMGAVILVGMTLNQNRLGIQEQLSVGQDVPAALAAVQLMQDLERADRVRIVDAATIQIRRPQMTTAGCTGVIPAPACFDDAANYRWVEYAHVNVDAGIPGRDALRVYDNTTVGCATTRVLSGQIGLVQFAYADAAAAPPGGDPFAPSTDDNNVVDYQVRWNGPVLGGVVLSPTSRLFRGQVAIRAAPYSHVNANGASGDSGLGLAPVGVSNPPAVCRT